MLTDMTRYRRKNETKYRSDEKRRKKRLAATGWHLGNKTILEIEREITRSHCVQNSLLEKG